MTTHDVSIRPAGPGDAKGIWQTLEPTIRIGETSPLPRDMTQEDALSYWFATGREAITTSGPLESELTSDCLADPATHSVVEPSGRGLLPEEPDEPDAERKLAS